jgi:DNA polymerase (family 10)
MTQATITTVLAAFREMTHYLGHTGRPGDDQRARVYESASEQLHQLDDAALRALQPGQLKGVGAGICTRIHEILATGTTAELEAFRRNERLPPFSLVDLLTIPGIGPKKAAELWRQYGLTCLADLEAAVAAGTRLDLKGLAHEKLVQALSFRRTEAQRTPLYLVTTTVEAILARLRRVCGRAEAAGSYRRQRSLIRDVDILVLADEVAWAQTTAVLKEQGELVADGPAKKRLWLPQPAPIQIDLLRVPAAEFGSAWQYFTGSQDHSIALRQEALRQGWSLSEHGWTPVDRRGNPIGPVQPCRTEQEVYGRLGLPVPPPEIREGHELIRKIPRLPTGKHITGELHVHSEWSTDASGTVAELAEHARARGYQWLGLADHVNARGRVKTPHDLKRVNAELVAAEEAIGVRMLLGAELDLDADGVPTGVPAAHYQHYDFFVLSIHTQHDRDPVGRYVKAIEQLRADANAPPVLVIGHPTTRLHGSRPIPAADWSTLWQACAKHDVYVELNGQRLDLPEELIPGAVAAGCTFTLASDAHSVDQLGAIAFALSLARRGVVPPARILTVLPAALQ